MRRVAPTGSRHPAKLGRQYATSYGSHHASSWRSHSLLKGYWHRLWNIKHFYRCVQVVFEIIFDTNNDSRLPARVEHVERKPCNRFWQTRCHYDVTTGTRFPLVKWQNVGSVGHVTNVSFKARHMASLEILQVLRQEMSLVWKWWFFLHLIQVFIKSEDGVKTVVASHVWITAAEVQAWFCEARALVLYVTNACFFLEISLWCPRDQNVVLLLLLLSSVFVERQCKCVHRQTVTENWLTTRWRLLITPLPRVAFVWSWPPGRHWQN